MIHRDVLIKPIGQEVLVISADNSANIGSAEHDYIKVKPEIVGALTARVALLEAASIGAKLEAMSCTLGFPFDGDHAKLIISGINNEMAKFGLDKTCLTGSSETNFPATITAIGVTAIGVVKNISELLVNKLADNDSIFVIGEPFVGNEVVENLGALPHAMTLASLKKISGVHEIIPCGSGGIKAELNYLTNKLGWQIDRSVNNTVDLQKSAGPATCFLVIGAFAKEELNQLNKSVSYIGKIRSK